MELQAVVDFAREAGILPAAMLLWVMLQLKGIKGAVAALPCKGKRNPPTGPRLRKVPDDECENVATGS